MAESYISELGDSLSHGVANTNGDRVKIIAPKLYNDGNGNHPSIATALDNRLVATSGTKALAWGSSTTIGTVGGSDVKISLPANPDTDVKVTQTVDTSNDAAYPLLAKNTTATATITDTSRFTSGVTLNPKNKSITATTFIGALSGNATTATTATKLLVIDQPAWSQSVSHTSYIIGWDSNNTPITNASQLVRSTRLWSTLYTINGVSESYFYCDHLRVMSPDTDSGFEPLLTESRYFTWMDVTANNITTSRVLHGIGKIGSDDTGDKTTFEGFGLLFNENKDKFLKYKSSYIIFNSTDWNEPYTDITISNIKFRGQAYEAYQAISAKPNSSLATTLDSAAQTVTCTAVTNTNEYRSLLYMASASPTSGANASLAYTGWLTYNPYSDTLNIGANTSSGTRTQITPGSLELYNLSNNVTKRMKLEPTVIRMESNATQAIKISVDSTSPSQLNFEYTNSSTTILADLNAKTLTATSVTASSDLYIGANSVSSLLAAKMPYIYNMTSTVYDFNGADTATTALTASGIYAINVGSSSLNKPTSSFSGRCTVFVVNSDNYITQTVFESHVYYRHSNRSSNGGISSWSDWVTLLETTTTNRMEVTSAVGTANDTIYFT